MFQESRFSSLNLLSYFLIWFIRVFLRVASIICSFCLYPCSYCTDPIPPGPRAEPVGALRDGLHIRKRAWYFAAPNRGWRASKMRPKTFWPPANSAKCFQRENERARKRRNDEKAFQRLQGKGQRRVGKGNRTRLRGRSLVVATSGRASPM